jgi:hypothetical protein
MRVKHKVVGRASFKKQKVSHQVEFALSSWMLVTRKKLAYSRGFPPISPKIGEVLYSDNAISAITRFYYGENHDFTNQYFPHHLFAFSLNNMPTITLEEETLI